MPANRGMTPRQSVIAECERRGRAVVITGCIGLLEGAEADDESWRVREMAAKVIARHHIGDALAAVVALTEDPVPRVGAAGDRAVMILSAARA